MYILEAVAQENPKSRQQHAAITLTRNTGVDVGDELEV